VSPCDLCWVENLFWVDVCCVPGKEEGEGMQGIAANGKHQCTISVEYKGRLKEFYVDMKG